MASSNNTTQPTPLPRTLKNLLDLPAEIRHQIYGYVFANAQVEAVCAAPAHCPLARGSLRSLDYHPDASLNAPDVHKLALTKVCRQTRHEAFPVFLETASFDISYTCYGLHRSHLGGSPSIAAIENFENCLRRIRHSYKSVWGITQNTSSSSLECVASAWFNNQRNYPNMQEVTLHIKWYYTDYYRNKDCQRYLKGLRTLIATKQALRVNIEICLLKSREQEPDDLNGESEAPTQPTFTRFTLIDGKLQPYTRIFGGALMIWQTHVLKSLGLSHPPSILPPRSQRYTSIISRIKV